MASLGDLPDAVLVAILQRVDVLTLVRSVARTNRRLRALATSEALWLDRLPPALALALRGAPGSSASASATGLDLPSLYCSLYNANLLQNPWFCLEEQLALRRSAAGDGPGRAKPPWVAVGGGQPWQWGEPAMEGLTLPSQHGAEPPHPPVPVPPFSAQGGPCWRPAGAVASSRSGHAWPALMQEVDLVAQLQLRGLTPAAACAFLDSCPALLLEVYTAGRFDCPGEFEARLVLDSRSGPPPAAHFELEAWMGGAAALASTGARSAVPCQWRRQTVMLEGYPPGVRRALVLLRGTERRFWSGHYGAKFAAPSLCFLPPPPRGS